MSSGRSAQPSGRDVDDASIGHTGSEAMFKRERARHPVAGLADADHCDASGIDVGAGEHRVEHRCENRFPVMAERGVLLV